MSNAALIKLAVGVMVLALGLLLFSSLSTEDKSPRKKRDDTCPECGQPYPRGSKVCINCKMGGSGKGKKAGAQSARSGKTHYVIVGLITFLILGTSYLIYRQLRGRTPVAEEEIFHFRCPYCKRKLGFRPRKAGKEVLCPGCRKMVRLPNLD